MFAFGGLILRSHCIHRPAPVRTSVIATTVALLASAAPAAASYQSGWGFFGAPPAIYAPEVPRLRAIDRGARKAAKAKKLSKELGKNAEKAPSGPLHIVISVKKQQMTVYAGGQPIAHSPVSTGVPGHPTPQGVFSVIQKQIYHESNIYSSAPMPYMQRITWSGVAMHQGVVPGRPASHGCIRLPPAFARRLWAMTKIGARVIIAQDDVALRDITSGRLFTAVPQVVGEATPALLPPKVRIADNLAATDAPLKGSIDAGESKRIEPAAQGNGAPAAEAAASPLQDDEVVRAIDRAALAGIEELTAPSALPEALLPAFEKTKVAETAKDAMLKPGPISVYVSRKLGKLFVRKGFDEVFDAPVSIAAPDQPLGTHVFTALEANRDGSMRWNVASLPTDHLVKQGKYLTTYTSRGEKLRKELVAPTLQVQPPGDPSSALDRITIPDAALARITRLMSPGATLIISDLGLSSETGRGTDFIVLTR